MGFLSKAWKSVKSGFKKIGKAIKSAAKKVGKFMDKIGVVGQIALAFVLPGVGSALSGALGRGVAALAGSNSAILSGVGKVLQTAGKFANTVGNTFKTVSDGIGSFVNTMAKGTVNSIGKMLGKSTPIFSSAPDSISGAFNQWMKGVSDNVNNIASPWKTASEEAIASVENTYTRSMSYPLEDEPFGFPDVGTTSASTGNRWTVESLYGEDPWIRPEVSNESFKNITTSTNNSWTQYARDVGKYALNTIKKAPEAAIDTASSAVQSGVKNVAMEAMGLGQPEPVYNTYVNQVPSFDTSRPDSYFAASGLDNGGTFQHALEFYAANNSGYGSFGRNAYQSYVPMRA